MIPRDIVTVNPSERNETHYRINPDTSHTTLFSVTVSSAEYRLETHGFDIEGYHRRLRRGDLIPHTPYERFECDWSLRPGYYHRYNPAIATSYHTDTNWDYAPATDVATRYNDIGVPRAEAKLKDFGSAVQKAASNIYSQGHDSLTFVAELTKTIAMFRTARESLIKLLTETTKGKTLAQSWLEFRYGWRTLYYDMVDITHALSNLADKRTRFSERAGSSSTLTSVSYVSAGTPTVSDVSFVYTISETKKISLRGSVTADIDPPEFRFNPAITAWELVRFSFIIDWFINVGLWLEALSFLTFTTNYAASGGVKIDISRSCDLTTLVFATGQTGSGTAGADMKASYSIRIPTSVPIIPLVNVRVDVPKFIDLWALTTGKIPLGTTRL